MSTCLMIPAPCSYTCRAASVRCATLQLKGRQHIVTNTADGHESQPNHQCISRPPCRGWMVIVDHNWWYVPVRDLWQMASYSGSGPLSPARKLSEPLYSRLGPVTPSSCSESNTTTYEPFTCVIPLASNFECPFKSSKRPTVHPTAVARAHALH